MDFDNTILSSIKTPLPTLLSRNITLLINSHFKVLFASGMLLETCFQSLKPGVSIDSFFDFNGLSSFDSIPDGQASFPSKKNEPLISIASEPFYTAFPFATLRIEKIKNDLYLGIIGISNIFPNFFPEQLSTIIYADQADSLLGFNQSFLNYFKEVAGGPEKMLHKPLSLFLSPTPNEIQDGLLKEDAIVDFESFTETMTRTDIRGRRWENSGDGNDHIVASFPDMEKRVDVVLELECRIHHGASPILSVGYGAARSPDDYIYVAATQAALGQAIIKKIGFIVVSGVKIESSETLTTFRFCISGQSLFYFQDHRLLCAYSDPHMRQDNPTSLAVSLRKDSACTLEKLTLKTRPAKSRPPERAMKMVVALKTRPIQYFQLNRFYNFSLSSSAIFAEVAGYILQDVTHLQQTISKLSTEYRKKVTESELLKNELLKQRESSHPFIGSSIAVQSVKSKAMIIAQSRATVLIQGPTGTGKEVLANFIHLNSPMRNGPFVKVDCSSLPDSLIESELFGHEKGAFTGADARKIGKFELANHGTLFIDEVGNLSPTIQVKLLHFLQDFTMSRVGGNTSIQLNLRIVAATNFPLQDLVRIGRFREDLYYRLYVMVINLPPLKERREDLLELAEHYLRSYSEAGGKAAPRLSQEAYLKLYNHTWPGNIRELTNVIQRAVIFCQGSEITRDHIMLEESGKKEGLKLPNQNASAQKAPRTLLYSKKEDLLELLKRNHGNIALVAKELDVSRRALYYYCKREAVDLKEIRSSILKNPPFSV